MSNNICEVEKYSNAYLVQMWAKERGVVPTPKKKSNPDTKTRAEKQASKKRNYKGIEGRISKSGANGWFEVDERGRFICV